jgi:hypothetical protein
MTARDRAAPLVLIGSVASGTGDDSGSYRAVLVAGQRLLAAELSRRIADVGATAVEAVPETNVSVTPTGAEESTSPFHWGRWFTREAGTALARVARGGGTPAAVGWAAPGALALVGDEALGHLLTPDPGEVMANNRFSADAFVVAADGPTAPGSLAVQPVLDRLAACPTDNGAVRCLENAGFRARDLADQPWSRFDVDTPHDLALLSLATSLGRARQMEPAVSGFLTMTHLPGDRPLGVPYLEELGAVMRDRRAQLVVAGRVPGRMVQYLETETACRVRWFIEERGMRSARDDRPRSLLGRWVEERGSDALVSELATLGDAVILDSRVLMASIAGSAEAERWPPAEERFAADFGDAARIGTPWLRELVEAVVASSVPFVLGGHTLVSDGIQLLVEAAWAGH